MKSPKLRSFVLALLMLVAAGFLSLTNIGRFSYKFPVNSTEAVQAALAETSKGRVLYDIPSEMVEGKEVTVPVRISADMVEDLTKGLSDANEATTEPIAAFTLMGVRLQGDDGFKIVRPPEEDQFVSKDRFSEWNYKVTPIASGDHVLTLLIGVRVMLPGGHEESRFDPILERNVAVKVNVRYATMRFLGDHIELFITACVFGPLGFFLSRWIERRDRLKNKREKGQNEEPKDKAVGNAAQA